MANTKMRLKKQITKFFMNHIAEEIIIKTLGYAKGV